MKRNISILITLIFCLMIFMPVSVSAETYPLAETDMSIQVDDSRWYVFTRDNIENNSELDELGISYDTIQEILYNNQAYMDAILFYDDGEYVEFFVRKKPLDIGVANLSNYENSKVLEFAQEVAKNQNSDTYSVYENEYKFAKSEYVDSDLGYYICEYVTIVNKDNYTFTFQSASQFSDSEHEEIKGIIDSVQFDIDTSLKEPQNTSLWSNVITKTVGGAVIGGVVSLITAFVNKKKKKKNETDLQSYNDISDQ